MSKEKYRQSYFTACLPRLAGLGYQVGYTLTSGQPWIEIDFEADWERAARDVLPFVLSFFRQAS